MTERTVRNLSYGKYKLRRTIDGVTRVYDLVDSVLLTEGGKLVVKPIHYRSRSWNFEPTAGDAGGGCRSFLCNAGSSEIIAESRGRA